MFKGVNFRDVREAFFETLFMNITTSIFVLVFGLLLGYSLYKLENKNKIWYNVVNVISSILRSIPFLTLTNQEVSFFKHS